MDKVYQSPAVSVLMLLYNRPQYMRMAIESVINQTFRDFEFIILDNGSQGEEVYKTAKEYADKDSRISLSRVAVNCGVHEGRNILLDKAHGEYVATIEDDDYWRLDKLQKQTDFMQKNPKAGVYSCSYTFINAEGEKTGEIILKKHIHQPTKKLEDMTWIGNHLGSGLIFLRDALLDVGGWRRYFIGADDNDLFFRLQENYSFAATDEKLIYYRKWDKQLTREYYSWLYAAAAIISAYCRRKNMEDLADKNLAVENIVMENFQVVALCMGDKESNRLLRRMAKGLICSRHYAVLRLLMLNCCPTNIKKKLRLRLLLWSLRYGRLGYWLEK